MTTYFIDPVNGADANAGTSWALAWKTIKSGATAARIAPGDVIRIAKSPDPVSIGNATWTDGNSALALASSLTGHLCRSYDTNMWMNATNVTCTVSSSYAKYGTRSAQLAVASAFTTGLIGYTGVEGSNNGADPVDFSAYTKVSFFLRTNIAVAAGVLKVCLCSDQNGTTIVHEFILPALPVGQIGITPFTFDNGSALNSAIKTIAIYAVSDPGAVTININHVIVCNTVSLISLLSKNGSQSGGTEAFHGIKYIDGTTVSLDCGPDTTAARLYSGTTETVTTYYRDPFRVPYNGTSTCDNTITDSGSSGSIIQYQGGYDTSLNEQNGETFYDFITESSTYGISISGNTYVTINRINPVRARYGVYLTSAPSFCSITAQTIGMCNTGIIIAGSAITIDTDNCINNTNAGMTVSGLGHNITAANLSGNLSYGMSATALHNSLFNITKTFRNGASNIYLGATCHDNVLNISESKYATGYGMEFITVTKNNRVIGMTTSNNTSGAINYSTAGDNFLKDCTLNEATVVANMNNYGIRLSAQNLNATQHKIFTYIGNIVSQTTTRHTASGIAWSLNPTSSSCTVYYPLTLPIAQLAVVANTLVTVTCWMQRSNIGITGMLMCKGSQLTGIPNDVISYITADAENWEQVGINFTPTEDGVVEIMAAAYGGTAYSVYVDDFECT